MTRIHGDFHLGQVLVADGDAYIIDFEGEPGASIAERRAKASPLRDVAGLLRSIDYAGATFIEREGVGAVPVDAAQRDHLLEQFRARAATAFLRAYWQATASRNSAAARNLLALFLIEKAAYEIADEAAHRPTWIWASQSPDFVRLTTRITGKETSVKMTNRRGWHQRGSRTRRLAKRVSRGMQRGWSIAGLRASTP